MMDCHQCSQVYPGALLMLTQKLLDCTGKHLKWERLSVSPVHKLYQEVGS